MTYLYVFIFCPFGRALSDTLRRQSSAPHTVRSSRRGLSGIGSRPVQRVQRLGVCVGAWRGLPCIWHGLPCYLCCSVCPGALGWGLHLWGIWGEPGVGWSTPRVEKIQKRRFIKGMVIHHPLFSAQNTPPPIANLKNFAQKQKDPYKGSVFCAILALQALKGRNLQWLKVK